MTLTFHECHVLPHSNASYDPCILIAAIIIIAYFDKKNIVLLTLNFNV